MVPGVLRGHRLRVHAAPFLRRALIALLLAVLAFGATLTQAPPATAEEDPIARAIAQQRALQERISKQQDAVVALEQQQEEIQAKLLHTSSSLLSINLDQEAMRAEIVSATAQLDSARQHHADLVMALAGLGATVEFLQEQADEFRIDLRRRRELLAAHLSEAYRAGLTSTLEQMLSSDSLLDGMVEQRGYLALGEQDVELARSIERDSLLLAAQQRQVSHVRYRTERIRRDVEAKAAELDVARDRLLAAEEKLARMEAETKKLLAAQKKHHAELLASKAAAEKLLKRQQLADKKLKARIKRLIIAEQHRGRLPSQYNGAVRWPLKGTITQEFGCTGFEWEPPLGDCAHFHKGVDVVGKDHKGGDGPNVVAAADGIILFVGFNPYDEATDPAWIVIIAHSDDLRTWYAHLQPRNLKAVKEGAKVKAGATIGYQGNSGHSTGAHLHWAVEFGDEFMNPRLFL